MTKFIIECRDGKYIMSLVDDYMSVSTIECDSIDESVYDMISILKDRTKKVADGVISTMVNIKELSGRDELPVEMIGVNLINSDKYKGRISKILGGIADEYLNYAALVK